MSTTSRFFGLFQSSLTPSKSIAGSGIVPLSDEQMHRTKGGFDTEGEEENDIGDASRVEEIDVTVGDPPVVEVTEG